MMLEQYSAILIKQWRLIVICFLVVGLGAFIVSKLMTRFYESTVLVQVAVRSGSNAVDYNDLLASDDLVQTEVTLATSDPVLLEVASHYPGLTAGQLSKEVTATSRLNTQIFEIDVQDPSPTRAAALANDIAKTLIQRQLQMAQQSSAQGGFLIVVQPAQPDSSPVRPNVLLNTGGGLLAGLLLGVLLAILFEQLDTRVRTVEVLRQLMSWPVLATIGQANSNESVINPGKPDAIVEAYRNLRTNIEFLAIDKPVLTLVVTSAMPREGKSVVAANLAIFMARAGKNTLLIDANLRQPVLHEKFGIPADKKGLSNAILAFSMPIAADSTVVSSDMSRDPKPSLEPFFNAVDIPNLCVMPSGPLPPNPTELLDSKAMQRFFRALDGCGAEVVIFDTPPVLGLSDASIVASKVDGTLIVVDITQAKKEKLKQMKDLPVLAGISVLGCVVNKQRRSRNDMVYSYYYGTDKQNNTKKQSAENVKLPPSLPITPDTLGRPETLSPPDLGEQKNGSREHSTSTVNSPALLPTILETNDKTIKLPLTRRMKNKKHEGGEIET